VKRVFFLILGAMFLFLLPQCILRDRWHKTFVRETFSCSQNSGDTYSEPCVCERDSQPEANCAGSQVEQIGLGSALVKICLFLATLAAIGGVVIFLKHRGVGKFCEKKTSSICVLDTLHLGQKHYLAVVECKERKFLIGITNDSINTIAELTMNSRTVAQNKGAHNVKK
jgi:flagellar biogenesis protein FliO